MQYQNGTVIKAFQLTTCEKEASLDVVNGTGPALPYKLLVQGYDVSQLSLTDMYIQMSLGFATEEELQIWEAEIHKHIRYGY